MRKLKEILFGFLLMSLSWFAAFPVYAAANSGITAEADQYGADGTDKADDTDALQSALNTGSRASDEAPLTVHISAGTYYISKPLRIYSNTKLILDPDAVIVRRDTSKFMLYSAYKNSTIPGYDQIKNVTISGGVWDGSAEEGSPATDLIALWHGNNIRLEDMTIKRCCGNHFIELVAVCNATVQNVIFQDFVYSSEVNYDYLNSSTAGTNKASIRSEALQLDYARADTAAMAMPLDGTACQNITVQNCSFYNCLSGVGSHHGQCSSNSIQILNNHFENMGSCCIDLPYMTDAIISGNTALNARAFLRASGGAVGAVTNNTITYGFDSVSDIFQQDVFYVSNSNLIIRNNEIYGAGKRVLYGIGDNVINLEDNIMDLRSFRPDGWNAVQISGGCLFAKGNTIINASGVGLYLAGTSGVIMENTISDTADNAIRISSCDDITMTKNIIQNPGINGVRIVNSNIAVFAENHISDAESNGINIELSSAVLKDNQIINAACNGICASLSEVTAEGNQISDVKRTGISLSDCIDTNCSANEIIRSGKHGFYLADTEAVMSENHISGSTGSGFCICENSNAKILKNEITDSGAHGISVIQSVVAISNNTVCDSAANGICLNASTFQVDSNTVRASGKKGIRILDGDSEKASGNITGNELYGPGISNISAGSITLNKNTVSQSTPILTGVSAEADGIRISWKPSAGAERYRVFYKTGKKWIKITDTSLTGYTWKNAKSGTKYTFTVRCLSGDGKSYTSAYDTAGKKITYIAAPKIKSAANSAAGVTIQWGKVSGAAKYRVYYKSAGGWVKIAETASASYTWKKAVSGKKYTFTVRSITKDGKNCAEAYDKQGKGVTYIAAPKISRAVKSKNKVTLKWNRVAGAVKYRVFYKTSRGWVKIADTASTSYTWKKAPAKGKYRYTVRCISANGKTYTSAYDSTGVVC